MKRGGPLKRRTPLKRKAPMRKPPSAFLVAFRRMWHQCVCCGKPTKTAHHRWPKSDAGEDSWGNCPPACDDCHEDFHNICGVPTRGAVQGHPEAHMENAKKWLAAHPHSKRTPTRRMLADYVLELLDDEPGRRIRELEAKRAEKEGDDGLVSKA